MGLLEDISIHSCLEIPFETHPYCWSKICENESASSIASHSFCHWSDAFHQPQAAGGDPSRPAEVLAQCRTALGWGDSRGGARLWGKEAGKEFYFRGFQVGFRIGIWFNYVSWVVGLPIFWNWFLLTCWQRYCILLELITEQIRANWTWMWWIGSIKVALLAASMMLWFWRKKKWSDGNRKASLHPTTHAKRYHTLSRVRFFALFMFPSCCGDLCGHLTVLFEERTSDGHLLKEQAKFLGCCCKVPGLPCLA